MQGQNNISDVFQVRKKTAEYIDSRIAEVQKHFEDRIESIRRINEKYFQLLCLFSLIDSLAQEYSNYSRGQEQKKFTNFVLEFQKKWDFLEYTDPITFYYDVQEHLIESVNLNSLSEGDVYSPAHMIKSEMTEKVVACLEEKGVQNIADCKRKHRYVDLLYKMRSKLSHELSTSGSVSPMGLGEKEPLPYYVSVSRVYSIDGNLIEDDIWELVVPVEFIERLLLDCLGNYLDFCKKTQRDPFSNNKFERKFRLAWYD
ncbi:hypothetical protein VLL09_03330 [Dehalococcoides mccartyi]|uniref:Uncharacterized protein n=1 Tax=Dehalococcoides mccartyi TaxID=61435 RepID=A0AB38ZBH8_9CHLR|nr:hypothetical protein [Dehalococcoides mccartyi]WRO07934.1 hypothetical protein VLL09_03330 [Dehalococcoides mccartyi]